MASVFTYVPVRSSTPLRPTTVTPIPLTLTRVGASVIGSRPGNTLPEIHQQLLVRRILDRVRCHGRRTESLAILCPRFYRPPNTKISGEAPSRPGFVRCILLFDGVSRALVSRSDRPFIQPAKVQAPAAELGSLERARTFTVVALPPHCRVAGREAATGATATAPDKEPPQ